MALLVHRSLEPAERDRASKAHKNPINYINAKWRRSTSIHRLVRRGGGMALAAVLVVCGIITTRGSRRGITVVYGSIFRHHATPAYTTPMICIQYIIYFW